jgi:hypothetical protein
MSSAPKIPTGVGASVVPAGLRLSVHIDYVKLLIRFPEMRQISSVTKHMPIEWTPFTKINIAAHMPNAVSNESKNSCNCHTITFHEPHKNRVSVMQLRFFLHDTGGTLDEEMEVIEWGVNLHPTKQYPLSRAQAGLLAEDFVKHLSVKGIGLHLTPEEATTRNGYGPKKTLSMAKDIERGQTVYIGKQPNWKDKHDRPVWNDSVGFKCYYKTKDRGRDLPTDEHCLRFEFTASASKCPASAIELLLNEKADKRTLAEYFKLELRSDEAQHRRRACLASMPPDMVARAKKAQRDPMAFAAFWVDEDCAKPAADSHWNERLTKSYDRMDAGYSVSEPWHFDELDEPHQLDDLEARP